jgi:hypothetical protein
MTLRIKRLHDHPIIAPAMLPGNDGANINGPSLIETPGWLPSRLGRYYLYFAHHSGTYIRLAYADHITGPWRIHAPGSLHLDHAPGCREHIASPDVHVDHQRRQIVMFFHGVSNRAPRQLTYLARSGDGLHFAGEEKPVALVYFRAIPWRQYWFGMSKGGIAYLSKGYDKPFRRFARPLLPMRHPLGNAPGDLRHLALDITGDLLAVYFSRIGDQPETLLRGVVDLSAHPLNWRIRDIEMVLKPEHDWEGAHLEAKPSRFGPSPGPENALRDPALFTCDDRKYLLYSTAGEAGIAMAEIVDH